MKDNYRRNYFTREQCPACWVYRPYPYDCWYHKGCGRTKAEHLYLIQEREAFKERLRQTEGDIAGLTAAAIDELIRRRGV